MQRAPVRANKSNLLPLHGALYTLMRCYTSSRQVVEIFWRCSIISWDTIQYQTISNNTIQYHAIPYLWSIPMFGECPFYLRYEQTDTIKIFQTKCVFFSTDIIDPLLCQLGIQREPKWFFLPWKSPFILSEATWGCLNGIELGQRAFFGPKIHFWEA